MSFVGFSTSSSIVCAQNHIRRICSSLAHYNVIVHHSKGGQDHYRTQEATYPISKSPDTLKEPQKMATDRRY